METISGDGMTANFVYDANGTMTSRTVNGTTYTQTFDVENRLTSVTTGGQTTTFYYDADGNRILSVQPDGTKVYTPFPEYEESITSGGTSTQRRHYTLAGQLIAVRVRTGATGNGMLSFAFNDHLGSVVAWADSTGAYLSDSTSRYEPYGGYRIKPIAGINPSISDRGFTGHRMNNTGSYDLGLIYMNARYYLPEVGRFISADTIVPEPRTPQSYNRYAYVLNSPTNLTDPSGHDVCTPDLSEVECSSGANLAYVTAPPHYGFAVAWVPIPFTSSSPADPRVALLQSLVCVGSQGCHFVASGVPVYATAPGVKPGAPRTQEQIKLGSALDSVAAAIDFSATSISSSYAAVHLIAALSGGPIGIEDGVVAAAYAQADLAENWQSRAAAIAVVAGDFASGESDFNREQLIIGQDSIVLAGSTIAGELAGRPSGIGPYLDTIVNLAVNAYDMGRLSGSVPNMFDFRLGSSGPYLLTYPQ